MSKHSNQKIHVYAPQEVQDKVQAVQATYGLVNRSLAFRAILAFAFDQMEQMAAAGLGHHINSFFETFKEGDSG